jgi:hypothetical protein
MKNHREQARKKEMPTPTKTRHPSSSSVPLGRALGLFLTLKAKITDEN